MKNIFKFIFALTTFALIIAGCSKKEVGGAIDKGKEEKGFVQLTISSDILPTFRGSEGIQESATAAELAINGSQGLKVYVFNEDGSLDYASPIAQNLTLTEQGTGTNVFKSEAFEVTAGTKFFFVFANDPASGGKITAPTTATAMENFMKQVVATINPGGALDIAVDNNFLLGTLWKGGTLAPGGGTSDTPNTVNLTVGRLASKVKLNAITYSTTNPDLLGTFSAGEYHLGTLPRNINTVGVYEGLLVPTNSDVLVISYVHNAPYSMGMPAVFNSIDYVQYSGYKAVNASNFFYTNENTTARDAVTGQQYFGNTSYIQIRTIYTPVAAEIFNPTTLVSGQTLGTATFWTAVIIPNPTTPEGQAIGGGKRIIITDPTSVTLHPDLVPTSLLEYTNGNNYHKFAIFDGKEEDDVKRFRVLRNHYYEFNVTNINDLGSNTSIVDPKEPIPTKTTVDIEVTVTNWDKISEDVEV